MSYKKVSRNVYGGSKKSNELHDKTLEKLKNDLGYDDKVAGAIKSLLYDLAKKKHPEEGMGEKKAQYMFDNTNKTFIKKELTNKMIEDRIKLIEEKRKNKDKK